VLSVVLPPSMNGQIDPALMKATLRQMGKIRRQTR